MNIDTYLNLLRRSFAGLGDEEREAILVEVRDYIDQESERIRNLEPGMDKGIAVERAIDEFGAPADIALVYDSTSEIMTIINQRSGESLLDMPELSGKVQGRRFTTGARGLRAIINYRRISAFAAIALMVMVFATLWFAGQDVDVASNEGDILYSYDAMTEDGEIVTAEFSEGFQVAEDVSQFTLHLDMTDVGGCAQVELVGPDSVVYYDTGLVCNQDQVRGERVFAGSGEWTIRYTYQDFTGHIDVAATVSGVA